MSIKREVQISLKLVPDKGNAKAASSVSDSVQKAHQSATSAAEKSATAQAKAADRAAKAAEKAAERKAAAEQKAAAKATAVADRAAKEEERQANRVATNRIKLIAQMQESRSKATKQAEKDSERAAKQAEAAAKAEKRELDRLQAAHAAASDKRVAAERQLLQAGQKTLQGLLDVAQGAAQVGLMSEENLDKFVRTFAKVQEGFRIMRGGISIIIGLSEAMQAYRSTTQAAAAAQGLLSAAQLASAGTGVASGAGGGVGRAVGGLGATAAAGYGGAALATGGGTGLSAAGIASGLGTAATVAGRFAKVLTVGVIAGEYLSRGLVKVGLTSESTGDALGGFMDALSKGAAVAEQAAARQERIKAKLERESVREQQINTAAGLRSGLRSELLGIASQQDAASGMSAADQAWEARKRGMSEVEQAEGAVAKAERDNQFRVENGDSFSHADQLQALERLKSARMEVAEADKASVEALRQQVEERKRAVEVATQEVDRARQLLDAENKRVDSAAARFGRLDAGQQSRLAEISAAGGPRSRAEAEFLDSTGLGTGKANDFFAQQGRAAGADNVLAGLGELDARSQAQEKLNTAIAEQTAAQAAQTAATEANTRAQEQLMKSLAPLAELSQRMVEIQGAQAGLTTGDIKAISGATGSLAQVIVDALAAVENKVRRDRQQVAANQG